jgi:two-component system NarL family sensor kinase
MAPSETDPYYAFLTALIVFTLLLIVGVISIFRHQGRRQKWLRELALRDIAMVEEERKRISADLHDDFGSVLASVRLGLDNLTDRYPADELIAKTIERLHISLSKLREISHNLLPRSIQLYGFASALEQLSEEINAGGRIRLVLNMAFRDEDIDSEKALLLYRVVQEIVTNSIKHAAASAIRLDMREANGRAFITMADDGKGFDYDHAMATSRSMGLQNIRSRLNVLQATCTVSSKPGFGTTYHISIPKNNLVLTNGSSRQSKDRSGR